MRFLHRLKKSQSGLAAVEFAILAPIMITMSFGAYDVSQFVSFGYKLDTVVNTVADTISRIDTNISESQVTSILQGGALAAKPFDMLANGRIRISAVDAIDSVNGKTGTILWQRCYGHGVLSASNIGTTGNVADYTSLAHAPPTDAPVYVAELSVQYAHSLNFGFLPSGMINRTVILPVRQHAPANVTAFGQTSTC